MVQGRYKSRKKAKVFTRAPGGLLKVHYKKRKPSGARCASCNRALFGVPRMLPFKLRNIPKSSKRPKRAFGGNLCSSCARDFLVQRARLKYSKQER